MLALIFNVRGLGGGPLACLRSYRAVAAGTTFNAVSEPERGEDVEDVVKLNTQGQVGGPQEELPEDQDELWKDKHWYRKAGIDAAAASSCYAGGSSSSELRGESHLVEVVKRLKQQEEIGPVLEAVRQWRKRKATMQQHALLSSNLTARLIAKLVALGEAEMAVKLVEEANGLGLGFAGTGSLRRVVVSLSTEGKLAHVTRLYEAMKEAGLRPSRSYAYALVRAFRDNGQPELAAAYAQELEANDIPMRPSLRAATQAP